MEEQTNGFQFFNSSGISQYIGSNNNIGNNTINTVQIVVEDNQVGSNKYKAKLYINGKNVGIYEYNTEPTIVSANISIGKRCITNTNFLVADIYSVRIYNRALSEHEIGINYTLDKLNFAQ